ncbi:tetratricopeptide repeat protein [Clostridioides difficile]
MSKDYLLSLCVAFILFTITICFLFLDKKENKLEKLKKLVLSVVVSTGLFTSFYLVFGNSKNYNINEVGVGLSIFGMLATAWIGLNIYNLVEKKEVDYLQKKLKESIECIDVIKKELEKSKKDMHKKILESEKNNFIQSMVTLYAAEYDYDKAFYYADKIVDEYPQEAIGYSKRGNAHYLLERYDDALNDFKKAIELNPDDSMLYIDIAHVYESLGERNNALYSYNKSIKIDENNSIPYLFRGCFYREIVDYENALNDFSRVIETDKNTILGYLSRASIYRKLGRVNDALNDYDELVKKGNVDGYVERGELYFEIGDYENALNDFKKALTIRPDDDRSLDYKIIIESKLNELKKV